MLRGLRGCKATLTDVVLLVVFLVLAYVFIHRRGYMSQVDDIIRQSRGLPRTNTGAAKNISGALLYEKIIDGRLKAIPDFRPKSCRAVTYKNTSPRVSIILYFFDYQFYDLKTTIGSILKNSPLALIKEIIVIDDGSTLQYIKEDASNYLKQIELARLYELQIQKGQAGAKMYGATQAQGDILVFLDGSVICSQGWLEPLVDVLETSSTSLVVPHYDEIHDPVSYEYKSTADNLVTTFSWSLALRMIGAKRKTDVLQPIDTVVMRGNAYAVMRDYFHKLGGYDDVMKDSAALAMELSLRAWMCGGSIRIVPCSRVGVLALTEPLKVVNAESVQRMTDLWITDRKDFIYKNTGIDGSQLDPRTESVSNRKDYLHSQGLQCKSFEWYMTTIAQSMFTPSANARFYGMLKCKTGLCARVGEDNRIDLGDCKPETFDQHSSDMLFEFDKSGFLRVGDRCLMVQPSAYVVAETCARSEDAHKWEHHAGGRMRNVWSGYCAMHVTDPDKTVQGGRQILMAQTCDSASTPDFITWEFIVP